MSPIIIDIDGEPVELGEGRGDLRNSSVPFSMWDGGPFIGDRPLSFAKIYSTQPWIAISVSRLLTWAIRVPLKLYRRLDDEGGRERLLPVDHPLARALVTPWQRGSQAELVQALLGPLCVHGNALLDIDQGARNQIRFDPTDWRIVTPIRQNDQNDPFDDIAGWKVHNPSGTVDVRSARRTMHLRWWSPLGQMGISPLQQLRSTIISEKAAVEWTINNLKQAARPSGVIELHEAVMNLKPEERRKVYETAVEDFRDNYGGEENAGKLPVMPPGMKWTTADHTTAVEAELASQRTINRNECAAAYHIPPPMIGQLERSTFNNIATLRELAYTDGLAPPLVLIEQLINAHVIDDLLAEDDLYVEFDLGHILRGDRLKEIKALREGISSALYTPNEGRSALNMPASDAPGADDLYLPTNNLAPIGASRDD